MTQLDLFSLTAKLPASEESASQGQLVAASEQEKKGIKKNTIMEEEEVQHFNAVEKAIIKNLQKKVTDNGQLIEVNKEQPVTNNIVFEDSRITVKIKNRGVNRDNGQPSADRNGDPAKPQPRRSIVTRQPKTEFSIALNEKLNSVKHNIKEALLHDAAEKKKRKKETQVVQKRGRKSLKENDVDLELINIPEDGVLFQKQYYPISEVAKWFNVNTSLLRFWENEFDILKPRKNRKGDRLFRPEDVKNLKLIYQLLRQRKFSIEGAKEFLKTDRTQADTQYQLTSTLLRFKSFLLELKANIQ